MLRVTNIQEDDFGCEERPDDWEPQVLVTLEGARGLRRVIRVPDRLLREKKLDIGSEYPDTELNQKEEEQT